MRESWHANGLGKPPSPGDVCELSGLAHDVLAASFKECI